jgi:hypothetical protein
MGRNAQRRRQAKQARRQAGRSPDGGLLAARLRPFDPGSLWTMLRAAGASPGVTHRTPSLACLVASAIRGGGAGGRRPARPNDLGGLLDAARRAEPALATLEDHVPVDPTLDVRVRFEERLYRLFPGSIERPVAAVARAALAAGAVDEHLRQQLGFGIADYVRVALREADTTLAAVAPAWPARPDLRVGGPARLTAAELAAAASLPTQWALDGSGERVERERAALAWGTAPPDTIPFLLDDPNSSFGRHVGVRDGDGLVRALPLAFLTESWQYGVVVLGQVAARNPACHRRFAIAAAQRLERALLRFGLVYGGRTGNQVVTSPDNRAHCLVQVTDRRVIAVQLLATLDAAKAQLPDEPAVVTLARRAKEDRDAGRQGTTQVPVAGGAVAIPAGSEVIPLLVVAAPAHLAVGISTGRGLAAMSLDDLTWISATADDRSDMDLYYFCRDLVELPGIGRLSGWETINYWEVWRGNRKAFHRSGTRIDFIGVVPHLGDAEWVQAAERSRLEALLFELDLPGLASWDRVSLRAIPEVVRWA